MCINQLTTIDSVYIFICRWQVPTKLLEFRGWRVCLGRSAAVVVIVVCLDVLQLTLLALRGGQDVRRRRAARLHFNLSHFDLCVVFGVACTGFNREQSCQRGSFGGFVVFVDFLSHETRCGLFSILGACAFVLMIMWKEHYCTYLYNSAQYISHIDRP